MPTAHQDVPRNFSAMLMTTPVVVMGQNTEKTRQKTFIPSSAKPKEMEIINEFKDTLKVRRT